MAKNNNKNKISYEADADVLTVESSNKPIDYAKEIGNIVVHFTKADEPVLFEVLNASKFFVKAGGVMKRGGAFKLFPFKKTIFA